MSMSEFKVQNSRNPSPQLPFHCLTLHVPIVKVKIISMSKFRVMFRNQPITTTVFSTTVKPAVMTEYTTITRRFPLG